MVFVRSINNKMALSLLQYPMHNPNDSFFIFPGKAGARWQG